MRTNWNAAALPRFILVASFTLLAPAWKTPAAPAADIIFTGQFITLDPSRPRIEALAVPREDSRAGSLQRSIGSARVEARIAFAGVRSRACPTPTALGGMATARETRFRCPAEILRR